MTEAKTTKKKPAAEAKKTAKKAPAKKTTPKTEGRTSYAVFATGGKQYRVAVGDTLRIEKIIGPSTGSGQATYKEGDKMVFDKVLLVDDGTEGATIGTPFISGAAVNATLTKIGRAKKVTTIKYKQKSRYFKKYGHRQPYFEITIDSIK